MAMCVRTGGGSHWSVLTGSANSIAQNFRSQQSITLGIPVLGNISATRRARARAMGEGDNVPKLLGQKPLRHLVKIVNVWQIVSFQYILMSVVNVLQ